MTEGDNVYHLYFPDHLDVMRHIVYRWIYSREDEMIKWLSKPKAHNYVAAREYLSLMFNPSLAESLVDKLKKGKIEKFLAKDIIRASGSKLIPISNMRIDANEKKIKTGISLSPILLVRGIQKLIVADGYHRLCAVYCYDEEASMPCKIV